MKWIVLLICWTPICFSQQLEVPGIENLHKVNDQLYRSGQPSKEGFSSLDSIGIHTVISLRNRVKDDRRAKHTDLNLERIRVNTWRMNETDIVAALNLIQSSTTPVLIHCLHGSDRTGVIIAAYRMVIEGWSKEKAIEAFLAAEYGYHEG